MISGMNPSEREIFQIGEKLSDLSTIDGVLNRLEERRNNALGGGVNCIPLPFSRFRSEIPGIEQGQYVLITANQKVSPH